MKKITKYILTPIVFLSSFLFSKVVLAASAPVYGPPVQTLYGIMPVPTFDEPWWSILLLPIVLPLIALVALIIGIVVTLKRRDKTKPGSNKKSIIKIIVMIIGFIVFLLICSFLRNSTIGGQTIYGGPDMLR